MVFAFLNLFLSGVWYVVVLIRYTNACNYIGLISLHDNNEKNRVDDGFINLRCIIYGTKIGYIYVQYRLERTLLPTLLWILVYKKITCASRDNWSKGLKIKENDLNIVWSLSIDTVFTVRIDFALKIIIPSIR